MRSPAENVQFPLFRLIWYFDAETEIDDLGRFGFLLKQYVVQFQITMRVTPLVHVSQAGDYLTDDHLAEVLWHPLVFQFLNMMVQTRPHTLLHHQVDMCPLIDHLKQRHNVGVVQVWQRVYFSVDCLSSLLISQVFLLVRLDCRCVFGLLMYGAFHYGESTCTDLETKPEVLDDQRLLLRAVTAAGLDIVDKGFKLCPLTSIFLLAASCCCLVNEVHAIILGSIFGSCLILSRLDFMFVLLQLSAHMCAIRHFCGFRNNCFVSGGARLLAHQWVTT